MFSADLVWCGLALPAVFCVLVVNRVAPFSELEKGMSLSEQLTGINPAVLFICR